MANTPLKISQLTSGVPAQSGDLIPIDRAGANFSITVASIAALASQANQVTGEQLSSPTNPTANGTRTTWTLAGPTIGGSAAVYQNGARLMLNVDYTQTGLTLTWFSPPQPGDELQADYQL